jgi:hypothetical protein
MLVELGIHPKQLSEDAPDKADDPLRRQLRDALEKLHQRQMRSSGLVPPFLGLGMKHPNAPRPYGALGGFGMSDYLGKPPFRNFFPLPRPAWPHGPAGRFFVGRGDGGRPGFDSARTRTFGPRVDLRYLHSLDMERLLDSTLDEAPALRELSLVSAAAGDLVPLVEGGLSKALASQFDQRDVDGLRKWATDSPRAAHNLSALLGSIPLDVDLLTLSPRSSEGNTGAVEYRATVRFGGVIVSRGQASDSDNAATGQRQPFLSNLYSDLLNSITSSLGSLRVERLASFALPAGHPAMAAPKNASFRRRPHRFGEDRTAASQPVAHSPTGGGGEESAHSSPEPEADSAGDEGPSGSAEESKPCVPDVAAPCAPSEEPHDVEPPPEADQPIVAPATERE